MKNSINEDYGHFDPDFIDQNTLIDGTYSVEDEYKQELKKSNQKEFGESDPDHYEQNTLIDNDNYARDEDPYQYQEEFIEDPKHPHGDFEPNTTIRSENIPNQERIINEDDAITNDGTEDDLNDNYDPEVDYENDLEKDGYLDNNDEPEDMDDFEAEHYPENHPRE